MCERVHFSAAAVRERCQVPSDFCLNYQGVAIRLTIWRAI